MSVELQTGNTNKAITNQSDGQLYASIVGKGSYVMDVGSKCAASLADTNTLVVQDGSIIHNGRHILMQGATNFTIPSGVQAQRRSNIAIIRTSVNQDGIEQSIPMVLSGVPTSDGEPEDPEWNTDSMLDGATISDMPLYRVITDGINTEPPVQLFETMDSLKEQKDRWDSQCHGTVEATVGAASASNGKSIIADIEFDHKYERKPVVLATLETGGAAVGTGMVYGVSVASVSNSGASLMFYNYRPSAMTLKANWVALPRKN